MIKEKLFKLRKKINEMYFKKNYQNGKLLDKKKCLGNL